MGDMLNTRPLDHAQGEIDYKPISAWAVAALTVSALYVLVVGAFAITAIYTKQPALSNTWMFAIIGVVLSIMARAHIKRSEGTRVGLKYATMAWWLSVVGGATFWAYNYASKVALKQQAERAADEWFENLKQARTDPVRLNKAFLLTQDPTARQEMDPGDNAALDAKFGGGPLPGFRNSDLVRYFERNGTDVSYESLGVSSWEQIDTGYKLDYTYQLQSAEGIANLNVTLFGSEGKNFVGREWHIGTQQGGGLTIVSSTTYGSLLQRLHDEAREVAMTWVVMYSGKESAEYYLLTRPVAERPALAATLNAIRIVIRKVGLPIPMLTLAGVPGLEIPAEAKTDPVVFHALLNNGFFSIGTITEDKKSKLRDAFKVGVMMRGGDSRLVNPETTPQIVVTPQEVRYTFPIDMALGGRSGGFCGGRLVIVSQSPGLVAALSDLYAKGKASPAQKSVQAEVASILARFPRDWRVAQLETTLEGLVAPKQGPGGPGGRPTAPIEGAQ